MVSWHTEKGEFPLYCTNGMRGFFDTFVCFQPNQRGQKRAVCLQSSSLGFRSRLKCVVAGTEASIGVECLPDQMSVWTGHIQSVVVLLPPTLAACTELTPKEHCILFSGGHSVLWRESPPGWLYPIWACKNKGVVEKRQGMWITWLCLWCVLLRFS